MMRSIYNATALVVVLGLAVGQLQASDPTVNGDVKGIELCPQFICGSALFTGVFVGEVNGRPAFGTWSAAVNHEDLPTYDPEATQDENSVDVLGGHWRLRAYVLRRFFFRRRNLSGDFEMGTLTALPDNFYQVEVPMTVNSGGNGQIDLELLLDENSIPQPVSGTLSQPVPAVPASS
jgi:hypothetical protein